MVALKLFGGAVLEEDGHAITGAAVRRHPLALLAIVAIARSRAVSREKLINLLWPDVPAAVGRNRLTSTLYLLRRRLGPDLLLSSGDGIQLDQRSFSCDVWQFWQAVQAADADLASTIYAGPLLDGFYLEESLPFEDWVREHRQKLHALWRDAVAERARAAESGGNYADAARWWKQLAADDSLDSSTFRSLIAALVAADNTKEAVDVAEAHAMRLRREIGSDAEAIFRQSIARLKVDGSTDPGPAIRDDKAGNGIAVLPFEALAGTQDSVLAEGVHSGVLTRLSGVGGLGVIANTSLRRFLNTGAEVPEIAAQLGVRWVLEGDVQTVGERFRVCVRLIDAPLNRQTWGHEYVADLKADVFFEVLAEIAGAIVEELKVELSARAVTNLAKRPTESLEAYRLCIRGRLRLDQRGPDDMRAALQHFEEAVDLDPAYALAWIGIADCIGLLHAYGYADAADLPRAEAAIHTALDCDPECAEAHAALGRLLGQRNQHEQAMRSIQKAVVLKPAYAEAFAWMSVGRQFSGDTADAVKSSRQAVRLNPLSPEALNNLCSSYLFAGRYADAIRTAEDARELDDDYDSTQFLGAIARYEERRFHDALDELETLSVPWAGSGTRSVMAVCLAESNQPNAARKLLAEIQAAGHVFDEGLVLAALGEFDAAEAALDTAIFDGLDFATSYWPTVAVRYLFKRVWRAMPNDRCHESMLAKVRATWG
jgi:DNA-binding SARP family transcriptional activator